MATAKYLTARGWSKTDRAVTFGWEDADAYGIKQMEMCKGAAWNEMREERRQARKLQLQADRVKRRQADENLMTNGALWVEPNLTETDIRIQMQTYPGSASLSSIIRHLHTNYDKIRKQLNNDMSKVRYRAMINQRIYEMYPWSREGEIGCRQ